MQEKTKGAANRHGMKLINVKDEARHLVDSLPENAMHEIYVGQTVEQGLADRAAGRMVSVTNVRAQFGLPQ